jgi:pantoate--beta-alanine ligase
LKVLRTALEVRAWRAQVGRVGFVPTMGALHEGHASLIQYAAAECEAAAVSIFVNPTQFAPGEDLATYPRDEAGDLALCEQCSAAMVFAPSAQEMYPPGDETRVVPGRIAARLEGDARPGHFTGVATVVTKLFSIVRPDVAFFGQKDFQQLRVIQTMARDLRLGVRVVGRPTVRDSDGVAQSSRNRYLTLPERERALNLSRGLFDAREKWSKGERDPEKLRDRVRRFVDAAGIEADYVAVADPITLEELDGRADRAVILVAARVGRARLIDNVLLGMDVGDLTDNPPS